MCEIMPAGSITLHNVRAPSAVRRAELPHSLDCGGGAAASMIGDSFIAMPMLPLIFSFPSRNACDSTPCVQYSCLLPATGLQIHAKSKSPSRASRLAVSKTHLLLTKLPCHQVGKIFIVDGDPQVWLGLRRSIYKARGLVRTQV